MAKAIFFVVQSYCMKTISLKEFRTQPSYYQELSQEEDVVIMDDDSVVTVLTSNKEKALDEFLKLRGILKTSNQNTDDIVGDEIMKRCGF